MTLFALLSILHLCCSELEPIWQDSMDDFASHWMSTGTTEQISSTYYCTSSDCVEIPGWSNQDNWIIRTTALSIISNLDAYDSFLLQFDVILYDLESANNCMCNL
eukprot:233669_1